MGNPTAKNSGLYWIKPAGEPAPAQTCVDLDFDGGGWVLASYGFVDGSKTKAIPNMNHPDGYNWNPASRGNTNGLISLGKGAVLLARGAEYMLMAAGGTPNGCHIDTYSHVYKIAIANARNVANVTFSSHSVYRSGRTMHSFPFIVQALKGETSSPGRFEARYALAESLGVTWADSYPTMYGFCPSKDAGRSSQYNSGPAFPSVISGDGHRNGGGRAFPPDVANGHEGYTHRGWYSLDGVGKTGPMTIWFR